MASAGRGVQQQEGREQHTAAGVDQQQFSAACVAPHPCVARAMYTHAHAALLAWQAVEAALADTWVRGGDLLGLQRRLLRLGKPPRRWKRPAWAHAVAWEPPQVVIAGRPLTNATGAKSRFYAPDGEQVTVEELALQHYASEEGGRWLGLHTEGGVWATLFGLLLWDVLFAGEPWDDGACSYSCSCITCTRACDACTRTRARVHARQRLPTLAVVRTGMALAC